MDSFFPCGVLHMTHQRLEFASCICGSYFWIFRLNPFGELGPDEMSVGLCFLNASLYSGALKYEAGSRLASVFYTCAMW